MNFASRVTLDYVKIYSPKHYPLYPSVFLHPKTTKLSWLLLSSYSQ